MLFMVRDRPTLNLLRAGCVVAIRDALLFRPDPRVNGTRRT